MKKILGRIKLIVILPFVIASFAPAYVLADPQSAIQCGVNGAAGVTNCSTQPTTSLDQTVTTIVNLLSAAAGTAAVIMIIVGGLRYITSAGNQESAKSARNTILYAVIGLFIVALAQIIVHFVIHKAS